MKDVWKKFDQSELTHSSIHHLLAVNTLLKQYGYARAVDIAGHLNISRASVSITMNKLKEKGFIREDKNRFLQLAKKGTYIVNSVLSKRRIIEQFFNQVLDFRYYLRQTRMSKIFYFLNLYKFPQNVRKRYLTNFYALTVASLG